MNKKTQDFFKIFDASRYIEFVTLSKIAEDILGKCNSQIIRELLLNARDYHHKDKIIVTSNVIDASEQNVINQLRTLGYKVTIESVPGREYWNYIKIEFPK